MNELWYIVIGAGISLVMGGGYKLITLGIKKKYKLHDVDDDGIKANSKKIDVLRKERQDKETFCTKRFDLIDDAIPPILYSLYAIMVTMENGKINGEITKAKEFFSDSFKQEFSVKHRHNKKKD